LTYLTVNFAPQKRFALTRRMSYPSQDQQYDDDQ
jgi:hypothetical protein